MLEPQTDPTEPTPSVSQQEVYIDYEKLARDLFISDFFALDIEGQMHVFRNE